jgi:hypothetical protein
MARRSIIAAEAGRRNGNRAPGRHASAFAAAALAAYPSFHPGANAGSPDEQRMGDPQTRPSGGRLRIALRLLMLVGLYAVPIITAVRPVAYPVLDSDLWWHLRVGQWVWQNHTVPTNDPFTLYGREKEWVAYSWLFDVGLYGLYAAFGLAGVVAYRVVLSFAVTAALHRLVARREPRFLVATLWTGLGLLPISVLFDERPWMFTILFTTLTLDVVLDLRDGRPNRMYWLLPAVYALWANLHIQFVYGLGVLALACAAPALDGLLRRAVASDGAATLGSPSWRRLLLLTNLCAVATLLNPYHVRVYLVALEYAKQPGPYLLINELKSLEFRGPYDWATLALAGAALFALGRRKNIGGFEVLLLAGSAYLSFRARRDLWFVVVAALGIIAGGPKKAATDAERMRWTMPLRLAWVAALGALTVVMVRVQDLSSEHLQRVVDGVFPARAADFVIAQGYAGPVYNHLNWGGYLIWRLPPDLPVAIDGRTNLHGDERLQRNDDTWNGRPGWRDDPELASARVVIGAPAMPLSDLLRSDARFQLEYEDKGAVVFVRQP